MTKRHVSQRPAAVLAVALLAVGILSATTLALADDNNAPKVVAPSEVYGGLSYGQWAAAWWQWAFHVPANSNHPVFSGGNTLLSQSGGVWFLAGVFGVETRSITIPSGVALFFPVVNSECSMFEDPPYHGDDATSLAACANGFIDQASNLSAQIDGKAVKHLEQYRTLSPMFTIGPLPDPNILGAPAGTSTQSVDAGVYLLIPPLKPGHHTIRFKGTVGGGSLDTTYHIQVNP